MFFVRYLTNFFATHLFQNIFEYFNYLVFSEFEFFNSLNFFRKSSKYRNFNEKMEKKCHVQNGISPQSNIDIISFFLTLNIYTLINYWFILIQ